MRLLVPLLVLAAAVVVPSPAEASPWPYCFSKLDDMISDGGSTYCVDPNGKCRVRESREYIWGREESCVVP